MPPFPTISVRLVTIVEITVGNDALCRDPMGRVFRVPMSAMRAKGLKPRVGDEWIIDRMLGRWTFAAVVSFTPIIVTGDRSAGTALTNLLLALEEAGVIDDQTVA